MGPSIETFTDKNAFIPYGIEDMMKNAKPIPLMAGIVEEEGYMYIFGKALRPDGVHSIIIVD